MKYENKTNGNRTNSDKKEVVTYTDYNIFNGKVRLIRNGQAPLILDRDEAIDMAKSQGMNLVQIAYNKNDNPHSICKIMDYSKFKYDQKKKDKEAKRKQKAAIADTKEIKFSIRIEDGDKKTKLQKIKEILDGGDKVKITINLLRREMERSDYAKMTMREILVALENCAEMDVAPTFVGNLLSCVLRKKK